VDPPGKMFPKLILGKKPTGSDVLINGKLQFPLKDMPLGKGVLTHGKGNPPELLPLLGSLGTTPKPLGILHLKVTPTLDHSMLLIVLEEVEVSPLAMLKTKLTPH